jgi:hypothetical protein
MKKYVYHILIITAYLGIAVLLTWPVAARLATHIPGEATWAFDESTFIWNMWWFKFSILERGLSPLVSDFTFFPLGVNLTTYTFNLFNSALGLPLQLTGSLPVANNLVLLFSYVSSAYGMFLLSAYLLARHSPQTQQRELLYLAATAAGAVYAFSASRMMYVALGHYNFVTIQWFPFFTLFLLKTFHAGSRQTKHIILAGLFAALCIYAELTYSVFLLFISVIIFFDAWRRRAATIISLTSRLIAIGLVTLFITFPFILAVLPDFLDPAYAEPGWGEGLKLSADLVGLVTLTPLHPLSGLEWISELRAVIDGTSRFSDANTLFLGYGILVVAVIGYFAARKTTALWLWSVIIFTILSLGPLLTINGQNRFNLDGLEVTFPLPFTLLHYIPILSANRVPNRFGIPLTLTLAVLVGYGMAWMLHKSINLTAGARQGDKTKRGAVFTLILAVVLLGVLLFDQYSVPLPTTNAKIPDVYHQIGTETDEFVVMQLPLGWRNSYGTLGAERTQLQYYQAAHRRPMLGGNTSRNPSFKFDYFSNIPLFRAITEAELYRPVDDTTREQARLQAAELMTLYNIKYLVIHNPIPARKPYEDTYPATRQLALDLIPHQPEPVYQSPGVEAYAILQQELPNPLIIDFGTWPADPYRGQGWSANEEIFSATANWVTAPEAEIFFPYRGSGNREVTVQIAPFSYPGMPSQAVTLLLNGKPVSESLPLAEGWQEVQAVLPETLLKQGLNRLTLRFAQTAQPRQVLPYNPVIGSTGIQSPLDIEVNSGNDFAFITAGFGEQAVDASAHRRGVNVAVINPASGMVEAIKGFDTAANEFEAEALTNFIMGIPAGQIVVIATQGADAFDYLSPPAQKALETIGVIWPADSAPPLSAIGVKGATPGQAAQASGEGTAYLRLGASPDIRTLAAAADRISISAADQ